MTDRTEPPDDEFGHPIDVELDRTDDVHTEMNGQAIPIETYRTVHDWSTDRSLSTTVVLAVGRVLGTDLAGLPPLNELVDPDGLDRLFTPDHPDHGRTEGRLTFPYAGLRVTIDADGTITLQLEATEGEP